MNMMKMVIKKLQILYSKVKNILWKPQVMVQDNSCGPNNVDPTASGLVLTPTFSPLKEPNISTKFTSELSIITTPTMWIIHPYSGTCSNTMTKTILPKGIIIGSSNGNVLMYVPQWTLPTPLVRSLISLALLSLGLTVFTIIIFWK